MRVGEGVKGRKLGNGASIQNLKPKIPHLNNFYFKFELTTKARNYWFGSVEIQLQDQ